MFSLNADKGRQIFRLKQENLSTGFVENLILNFPENLPKSFAPLRKMNGKNFF
jgi:hypothetical protein